MENLDEKFNGDENNISKFIDELSKLLKEILEETGDNTEIDQIFIIERGEKGINYATAQLREPVKDLKYYESLLVKCIAEEKYEDAAMLRDIIKEMKNG